MRAFSVLFGVFGLVYYFSGISGLLAAVTLYVSCPLIFLLSTKLRRYIVFLNFVENPFTDYQNVKSHGIKGGRNFQIRHLSYIDHQRIHIGVWHILPRSSRDKVDSEELDTEDKINARFEDELRYDGKPVFLYIHGITFGRAYGHRLKLYKFLQDLDAHVITFDYRGFADSSNVLTSVGGQTEDTLAVYSWIRSICGNHRTVYFWGHSMGTGLTLKSMTLRHKYPFGGNPAESLPLPAGVVLEAPLSSSKDVSEEYSIFRLWTWMPHTKTINRTIFTVDEDIATKAIKYVWELKDLPILILHSMDDDIIYYKLGQKLFNTIKESRSSGGAPVYFESFQNKQHMWICEDDRLESLMEDFFLRHK